MDTHRRPLVTLLLLGGGFVIYAGQKVSSSIPGGSSYAVWTVLFGLPIFTLGLLTYQNSKRIAWFDVFLEKASHWLGVTQVQIVLLALSPLLGYICSLAAGPEQKMYSPGWAIAAWVLAIALAFLGGLRSAEEKPSVSRSTLLTLMLLIVLAFLLRGLSTGRIPILLSGDEGSSGMAAMGFVRGQWNNIFITSWYSFPSLFPFIQSLSIRVFGHTTEALRLVSALIGALTVGCVYLVGKTMFGQRAGLFAALGLAVLHFHVHFSRIGLNNIWDGLWYTVSIGALYIAWEKKSRWAYLLAGLAMGFGLYFYVSARALLLLVLAGILIAAIFQRKRFQQAIPDVFLMLLIAGVVVLPLAWYFIEQPQQFLAPLERVSFFRIISDVVASSGESAWEILAVQVGKGFGAFTLIPLRYWYTPGTPILRPIFAAFFYLGLIVLLLKYRGSRFVLLSLWLAVFGLIGGLSESVPAAQRLVAAAPVCMLIAGLGLDATTDVFENLWPKYRKAFTNLSYVVLCLAVLSDLYFYFFDYYGKSMVANKQSNGMIAEHVAKQVRDKPEGTQVAFFMIPNLGYYSIPSIQYLAPQVKGVDVPEPWSSFDKTLLNSDHIVFIIPASRQEEILELTKEYPNGYLSSDTSWNGELLFWVYDLP